jgi:hypothetical protein
MKNLFCVLFFSLFIQNNFLKADPWDCMTKEQAESLLAYLKENPFVFDYCDCCDKVAREDAEGGFKKLMGQLLRIDKMEIVPCSWDESQFSVNIKKCSILASGFAGDGVYIAAKIKSDDKEYYSRPWAISLNYCFSMDKVKNPVRLFEMIDYPAEDVNCWGFKKFPNPNTIPVSKLQKAYVKFYNKK